MSPVIHSFMRLRPGFDVREDPAPPRKANRSALRTGAIVAGGAGVAYAGVRAGNAAGQIQKTAAAAEKTARQVEKTAKTAQAATRMAARTAAKAGKGKVGRAVKKVFGLSKPKKSLRKEIAFGLFGKKFDPETHQPSPMASHLLKQTRAFNKKVNAKNWQHPKMQAEAGAISDLSMAGQQAGHLSGDDMEWVNHHISSEKEFSRNFRIVAFGMPVAKDRYIKGIHENDVEKASGHYGKSAAAGALLGLGLRKGGTRKAAMLKGALAGIGAQAVVRGATGLTKDQFGDRSPGAKFVDKLPAAALLTAGGVAIHGRIKGKLAGAAKAAKAVHFAVPVLRPRTAKAILHGSALAGGIMVADGLTSATVPMKGQDRREALGEGLKRGAVYGTGLAIAEPAILAGMKRAVRQPKKLSRALVKLTVGEAAARGWIMFEKNTRGVVMFRAQKQFFTDDNPTAKGVFADPIKAASGEQKAYTREPDGHDAHGEPQYKKNFTPPVFNSSQVLSAAYNKGRTAHKWGGRTARVGSDVVDAVKGKQKVDERGRPLKREWEKSYFKNAVGGAIAGAALLGHAKLYRDNVKIGGVGYRTRYNAGRDKFKAHVNRVVPGAYEMTVGAAAARGLIQFDYTAGDWDVRDQRGRSARVFAPGAGSRERREKRWHEKVATQRKLGAAAAVLAGGAGLIIGHKLTKRPLAAQVEREVGGAGQAAEEFLRRKRPGPGSAMA